MEDDELTPLTFAEYLKLEKTSAFRYEYIAGQLFELEPLSQEHDSIAINISAALYARLRESSCRVFSSEMKLWIEAADVAYYPDVMVVCDPEDNNPEFKTRPRAIVEVLSSNTAATDAREKFFAYQKLPSFQEYFLVAQDKIAIEAYRQDSHGNWQKECLGKTDPIRLESLGVTLTMAEVYDEIFID